MSIFAEGTAGDDRLDGSDDWDVLGDHLGGNDEIYAGAGDDILNVHRSSNILGSALIDAGAGNDRITFGSDVWDVDVVIRAGDGADDIVSTGGANVAIDAGAGDDVLDLDHDGAAYTIALGEGIDLVKFTGVSWVWNPGPAMTFTDFAAGAGGDRFLITHFLQYLVGWDGYANPFATGHLRLVQRGADAVIQYDRSGEGQDVIDLAIFENIEGSALTAFNIGFAGDGSATRGMGIVGTVGFDNLYGTGGGDTIRGGDGADWIYGGAGDDMLYGGDRTDSLYGSYGDDVLDGGNGGDLLVDEDGGDDRMVGRLGNDHFYAIRDGSEPASRLHLDGGEGDDVLRYSAPRDRNLDRVTMFGDAGADEFSVHGAFSVTIDAGADNDLVNLTLLQTSFTITLGTGADIVRVGDYGSHRAALGRIVVTDFATGDSGDRIELHATLIRTLLTGWDGSSNPFSTGDLRLAQRGADLLLQADRSGGADSFETVMILRGVQASALTAFNLGGLLPVDAPVILGTAGDDVLIGTVEPELLEGGAGDDRLDGGGAADTMAGGDGNDVYFIDSGADRIVESDGGGSDTVHAAFTYRLGAALENLVLTGAEPIDGYGNDAANGLTGNDGDNRLDGGAGADLMAGGAGGDLYLVDHAGDQVVEAADAGTDTIESRVSYELPDHVEQLVLTAAAASGTGNGGANAITGTMSANLLNGGGGADTLRGLGGDDVYIVDTAADLVVETAEMGSDTVRGNVDYTLPDHVEALILTGGGNLRGSGNDLANSLTGNAGNNFLDGGGGGDTMAGGKGHDTYVVNHPADTVVEEGSSGVDTVESGMSFTLPVHFEKLVLTGTFGLGGRGNAGANTITGNSGSNFLSGGSGNDVIDGGAGNDRLLGGLGDDVLKGGAGSDRFEFLTGPGAGNVDRILDFSTADDTIYLTRSAFTRIGPGGTLSASAFHEGTEAADSGDRIVYDQATGRIFYDPDGSGAAAATLFATVAAGTMLGNADFMIYG